MRIKGVWRLRKPVDRLHDRWLRFRGHSRAVILLYHSIADAAPAPYGITVSPHNFVEHLGVLREMGHPLSLRELVQAVGTGRVPHRAVVVTFDDGYADNLLIAQPLLEQFAIPATFFVAAGYVDAGREFWDDEVARVLLGPHPLPQSLHLSVPRRTAEWKLGQAAATPDLSSPATHVWNIGDRNCPTPRHRFFQSVYRFLLGLYPAERQEALDQLRSWSGVDVEVRPSHRPMTGEELASLAQSPLAEIGAHTVHHPALDSLPAAHQRNELLCSKERLEKITGNEVHSFSYPFGRYSRRTVGLAREIGFVAACTARAGVVWTGADPFRLARVTVPDESGSAFARRIEHWLGH